MTISFVQGNSGTSSLATSQAVAFTSSVTAGNLLVVAFSVNSSVQPSLGISDTLTSTWSTAVPFTTAAAIPIQLQVWYALVPAGGGSDTVTCTVGSGSADCRVWIHEYAGVDTLDQFSTATGTSATLNSGAQTTLHAAELIWGLGISNNGVTAAGSGFTLRETSASESTEDQIVSSTGSQSVTFPDAGGGSTWVCAMATFYSSSGGGGTVHTSSVTGALSHTGSHHKQINKLLIA